MNRRPHRVTNSRAAVHSVIYPHKAIEERAPEFAKNEIMEVLPKRKIPGTALLKKMAKDREKAKLNQESARVVEVSIDPHTVEDAIAGILADLEN